MKSVLAFILIVGSLLLSTASFADQKYNPYSGQWEYPSW